MRVLKLLLCEKKGNAELIGALIALPVLISLSLNPILMFLDLQKYSRLDDIAKTYIIRMETSGGLTAEDYGNLLNDLASAGFEISTVKIDYTPYPVEFGEEVALKITVPLTMKRIVLIKAGGLSNDTIQATVGPYVSVSKKNIE